MNCVSSHEIKRSLFWTLKQLTREKTLKKKINLAVSGYSPSQCQRDLATV